MSHWPARPGWLRFTCKKCISQCRKIGPKSSESRYQVHQSQPFPRVQTEASGYKYRLKERDVWSYGGNKRMKITVGTGSNILMVALQKSRCDILRSPITSLT